MKILHLCLASFYIDNYSYQENLLPIYHKKMGHDVEIIASLFNFDKNGKGYYEKNPKTYTNEYDIKVSRLAYKNQPFSKKMRCYKNTFNAIAKAKPDIIFVHGCQFLDISEVKRYVKKKPETQVFVDNHADFSNSATNWISKNVLHKIIWKSCAKQIEPYTTRFYGVLPARVDFLNKVYGIPEEKIELLVMGGDDYFVEKYTDNDEIMNTKNELNILPSDFVIVTGGKIDNAKKQILLLMDAVRNIENINIKLIVFGNVALELKDQFNKLLSDNRIIYLGWLSTEESYKYFSISNLVVFPGRHSVYWEQVVALGKPMMVKFWDGTTHIDIGGNVDYLIEDSVEEIQLKIEKLIEEPNKYELLRKNAQSIRKDCFLYSKIAKQSIHYYISMLND